uniref:Uncharacterized protein n=1 Tax=Mycobacterium phage Pygmy TaxID=3158879 RepID=A0AAU8GSW4_9CAUD
MTWTPPSLPPGGIVAAIAGRLGGVRVCRFTLEPTPAQEKR